MRSVIFLTEGKAFL